MSEEIRNNAWRKVTSVGNSWIVCKSKSHPGHVYYFNSLTGEAAWNLSDAEIEKAKNRTKRLEHLPGAKPTKCPEPKENPPTVPLKNSSEPSQSLSSEQFVINRNTEQQSSVLMQSNVTNSNSTFSTPFNQIMQAAQINNPDSLTPVCNFNSFNNSLSTYQLNNTPMVYNPKIWAVPQTQPLFITPGLATAVSHNVAPLNVTYNQTLSQPPIGLVLNSFDNPNPTASTTSATQPFYPRDLTNEQGAKCTINKKIGFTNKNDLRQKLTLKKRFNMETNNLGGSVSSRKTNTAALIGNNVEGIRSNDLNNRMESRCPETQLHETPSRIDVGPLRSLGPSDCNSDAWFIVVDLEVLLHEFKFLNTLTDSDEKCSLMVPKRVMEELKSYVTITENIQAKRILRFLSQQIDIGHAYMAEEPSKVEGDSMAEVIYSTCIELISINYHLILLTNDNELLTKCSTNINMFSIDEVKKFLMEVPNKQLVSSGPKKPIMSDELINKIKITVPNDATQNIELNTPTYINDIQSEEHMDNIPITPQQNNTLDKTKELVVVKQTVDAGIQTDLEDINASISMTYVVEKDPPNADSNLPQKTPVSVVSNNSDKKREIKLKRRILHKPPVISESEKKQFKWRRRTFTSFQEKEKISSHNDQNMNKKNEESQQATTLNNEIPELSQKPFINNVTLERPENKILDNSFESRESSINAEPENSTTKENVTIEETSTSGIISNTDSNVDADSTHSSSINQQLVCNRPSNKAMYEVDSVTMEQYLKTKCDEWISRFIQIMEEVLTQVLQQAPPFTDKDMPPPWTLHEAAQCVAKKFCGHESIKTAADKLSNILFQVKDAKGQITMNMTPYQYMQMYSYGVHLLAAIIEVLTSCEDIQIAVESLNKLLHDIRNPNMDSSANDVFNDSKLNNMSNNDVSACSDVPNSSDENPIQRKEISVRSHTKEVSKDKKSISSAEKLQKPVKFIRNIDVPISFFKSMNRQTTSQVESSKEQNLSQIREDNAQNANETNKEGTASDVPTCEPTIIRKFNKFPELEEKLKTKYNTKVFENHDFDLDYNESYDGYTTDDYFSDDGNFNDHNLDANDNQTIKGADTNEAYESISLKDDSLLSDENSKKFKYMMCMLLREIRDTLNQVRVLCDQYYKELKNPEGSSDLKYQLGKRAEIAHLHTIQLCRSLESMLEHEKKNPTESISELLEQAGINIRLVDTSLLFEYRIAVAKCKNYADEFLSSIQNIISDIKR